MSAFAKGTNLITTSSSIRSTMTTTRKTTSTIYPMLKITSSITIRWKPPGPPLSPYWSSFFPWETREDFSSPPAISLGEVSRRHLRISMQMQDLLISYVVRSCGIESWFQPRKKFKYHKLFFLHLHLHPHLLTFAEIGINMFNSSYVCFRFPKYFVIIFSSCLDYKNNWDRSYTLVNYWIIKVLDVLISAYTCDLHLSAYAAPWNFRTVETICTSSCVHIYDFLLSPETSGRGRSSVRWRYFPWPIR